MAGLRTWDFGSFDVYKVNPPLVRTIAATPVKLVGATLDWRRLSATPATRSEFALGEDFIAANRNRSIWLFTLARWICIPFSLVGGYVCFRWARELYGTGAGLLALSLWCFCPNILAHGALITPDATATGLGVLACYSFWRWLKQPTWRRTLLSGLALGLAELSKTTFIVFYPLWPLIWIVYRLPERQKMQTRDWLRESAMLVGRTVICLYVINLGYGFEGTGTRLGNFQFVSAALGTSREMKVPQGGGNRFTDTWLASLPMPLPENYILGIDLQKRDFERHRLPSYLRGEFGSKGWWYYYLYALAVKVPLGTWLLIVLAATRRFWSKGSSTHLPESNFTERASWRDEFILLAPAIVILMFVSAQTGFSEHMRYVLPIFPFVFVWISRVAVVFNRRNYIMASAAGITLAWSIISSLSVYPHSLSYFNELVGGPSGGPKHLIHSNVDWGQDLLFLKRWLKDHPEVKPLNLVYFGYFDPIYVGIEYKVPEELLSHDGVPVAFSKIPPGWYAISVNFIRGFPYFTYKGDGAKGNLRQYALTEFQKLEPVAMAGYSIYIYHVPENQSTSTP